ncbi:hypothetical protein NLX86_18340 [Streptomyces sp. A3M-1-3]|uniref:solute carrier family 23 protein n=1 Tax=Streptomyces sp. A3M-1-3 TaxID=2962044 RepID=UPI0020B82F1C|nr:solute carrier family 23 protein [Streptomyces sp. A3M-1-3]MCP3819983.1 hypothetical protein [Streptomyces sp. A3M-1-3]
MTSPSTAPHSADAPDPAAEPDLAASPGPAATPHPVDESRPYGRMILFGIQHVLVMAATPISAIFLMSATLGLNPDLTVNLLSAAFLLSGAGSLIQSLGPWKFGPKLPFVMLPGGSRSSSSWRSPSSTAYAPRPAPCCSPQPSTSSSCRSSPGC